VMKRGGGGVQSISLYSSKTTGILPEMEGPHGK
jgi:hypothetical protein